MRIMKLEELTVLGETFRDVEVTRVEYASGGTALQITSTTEGPISIPTINLSEYSHQPTTDNHVFIKDYSEGVGMADELVRRGVGTKTGRVVRFGPYDASAVEIELSEELRSE